MKQPGRAGAIASQKGPPGAGAKHQRQQHHVQPPRRPTSRVDQTSSETPNALPSTAPSGPVCSKPEFGITSELPALSVCRLEAREELLRKLRQHIDDPALAEFSCPICWETFWQPVRTVCGHAFCEACLLKSVLAQLGLEQPDVSCPMCRHPLHVDDVAVDQALLTRIRMVLSERCREEEARPPPSRGSNGRVWRGLPGVSGVTPLAAGNGVASRPGTGAHPGSPSRPDTANTVPGTAGTMAGATAPNNHSAPALDSVMLGLFAPGSSSAIAQSGAGSGTANSGSAGLGITVAPAPVSRTQNARQTQSGCGPRPARLATPRPVRTAQSGRSQVETQASNPGAKLSLSGVAPPGGTLGDSAAGSCSDSTSRHSAGTVRAGWIRVAPSAGNSHSSPVGVPPPRSAPSQQQPPRSASAQQQPALHSRPQGRQKSSQQKLLVVVEDHFPGPLSLEDIQAAGHDDVDIELAYITRTTPNSASDDLIGQSASGSTPARLRKRATSIPSGSASSPGSKAVPAQCPKTATETVKLRPGSQGRPRSSARIASARVHTPSSAASPVTGAGALGLAAPYESWGRTLPENAPPPVPRSLSAPNAAAEDSHAVQIRKTFKNGYAACSIGSADDRDWAADSGQERRTNSPSGMAGDAEAAELVEARSLVSRVVGTTATVCADVGRAIRRKSNGTGGSSAGSGAGQRGYTLGAHTAVCTGAWPNASGRRSSSGVAGGTVAPTAWRIEDIPPLHGVDGVCCRTTARSVADGQLPECSASSSPPGGASHRTTPQGGAASLSPVTIDDFAFADKYRKLLEDVL